MSEAPGPWQGGSVLVTGAAGMLGSQLLLDAPPGALAVGTDLVPAPGPGPTVKEVGVDLTSAEAIEGVLDRCHQLSGVIHAAAYTAVDKAEEEEALARRVNAESPRLLARACARRGVPLVLVSTDFVFDGTSTTPYVETDSTSPLGVYGRTKLEGEENARAAWSEGTRVVRTQWLYGPRGKHFPGTILGLAQERSELRVVDDQRGSPTTTLELAPALWDVLTKGEAGTYHAACEGVCSWYDLAGATLELSGSGTKVVPCGTEEYPRPAPRPAYSAMDSGKLARLRGRAMQPWRAALEDFLRAERGA